MLNNKIIKTFSSTFVPFSLPGYLVNAESYEIIQKRLMKLAKDFGLLSKSDDNKTVVIHFDPNLDIKKESVLHEKVYLPEELVKELTNGSYFESEKIYLHNICLHSEAKSVDISLGVDEGSNHKDIKFRANTGSDKVREFLLEEKNDFKIASNLVGYLEKSFNAKVVKLRIINLAKKLGLLTRESIDGSYHVFFNYDRNAERGYLPHKRVYLPEDWKKFFPKLTFKKEILYLCNVDFNSENSSVGVALGVEENNGEGGEPPRANASPSEVVYFSLKESEDIERVSSFLDYLEERFAVTSPVVEKVEMILAKNFEKKDSGLEVKFFNKDNMFLQTVVTTAVKKFKDMPYLGYKKTSDGSISVFRINRDKNINNNNFFRGEEICRFDAQTDKEEDLLSFYQNLKDVIYDERRKFIYNYFKDFLYKHAAQGKDNLFLKQDFGGDIYFKLLFIYCLGVKNECCPFDYQFFNATDQKPELDAVAVHEEKNGELSIKLVYSKVGMNEKNEEVKERVEIERTGANMVEYMKNIMEQAENVIKDSKLNSENYNIFVGTDNI